MQKTVLKEFGILLIKWKIFFERIKQYWLIALKTQPFGGCFILNYFYRNKIIECLQQQIK